MSETASDSDSDARTVDRLLVDFDIEIDRPKGSHTIEDVLHDAVIKNGGWPDGNVIFDFQTDDPELTLPEDIKKNVFTAMDIWQKSACVKFSARSQEDTHFVEFRLDEDNNFSSVGRIAKYKHSQGVTKQIIGLLEDAEVGHALHEIGHTLGLFHTHSRSDRDKYVKISSKKKKKNKDYIIFNEDSVDILGYDYQSIMHYPSVPAVRPIGSQLVGQRSYLSRGDISAVNKVYGCPSALYPLLTADTSGNKRRVVVFGQTVRNRIVKSIFTETEFNTQTTDLSMPLFSGLSSIKASDGSSLLFALKDQNTIVKIHQQEENWTAEEFAKLDVDEDGRAVSVVGNVMAAGFDDTGIPVLFGQCANGMIFKVADGVATYLPGPQSIDMKLNGSQIAVVAKAATPGNYNIFAIGTDHKDNSEVLRCCVRLDNNTSSWQSLGAVPKAIGGREICGGLFASSCKYGQVDIFAFGGNDYIIRMAYNDDNPNKLEWQDCGPVSTYISGKWLAVAPIPDLGYDLFATNRDGKIKCFMYDAGTKKLDTLDNDGKLKPVEKEGYVIIT